MSLKMSQIYRFLTCICLNYLTINQILKIQSFGYGLFFPGNWLLLKQEVYDFHPNLCLHDNVSIDAKYFSIRLLHVAKNLSDLLANYQKVQVGKDQEMAQSAKDSHSKNPRLEKTKLTIRYLYHENIS